MDLFGRLKYPNRRERFHAGEYPQLFSLVVRMAKCTQGELLVDGFFAAIGLAYELRVLCQTINAATTTRMVIFLR
jgi:hypothetical protein